MIDYSSIKEEKEEEEEEEEYAEKEEEEEDGEEEAEGEEDEEKEKYLPQSAPQLEPPLLAGGCEPSAGCSSDHESLKQDRNSTDEEEEDEAGLHSNK